MSPLIVAATNENINDGLKQRREWQTQREICHQGAFPYSSIFLSSSSGEAVLRPYTNQRQQMTHSTRNFLGNRS